MAASILKAVEQLVKRGFPESTAKKIVSGELPMDFQSRMQRAREQGFTTEALHAGNPDILRFDPRAPRRTVDEGYDEDSLGSFFTNDPVTAASYSGPGTATYRVLLNTDQFGRVNAQGQVYNVLDDARYIRPSGEAVDSVQAANTYLGKMPSQTDDFGVIAKEVGDKGVVIENVIDIGPKTKPMRMVAEGLSEGGSADYLSRLEQTGARTIIAQDPSTIRSYYGAAFDPDQVGSPNIMASAAPVAVGGVLGALGLPENATAADIAFAERPELSEQGQQDAQQMVLDILMNYFAPTRLAGREAQMMPMSQQMRGR